MTKKFLLVTLLSVPVFMFANEELPDYSPADVKSISYRVTISRDDVYDQEAWDKLVMDASGAIRRGQALKDDDKAATTELVDAFVRGIEEIYSRTPKDNDGIHGQMSIEISDTIDEE